MKAVILGTGTSVNAYKPCNSVRIGVNDIFKYFPVDHLISVDYPSVFKKERLNVIINSTPQLFLSPVIDWKRYFGDRFKQIKFANFRSDVSQIDQDGIYPYSIMSPYVAIVHAYKLGAKEIVIYGVDLLNHPTLSQDIKVERILRDIKTLNNHLLNRNVSLKVFNKSSALSDVLQYCSNE